MIRAAGPGDVRPVVAWLSGESPQVRLRAGWRPVARPADALDPARWFHVRRGSPDDAARIARNKIEVRKRVIDIGSTNADVIEGVRPLLAGRSLRLSGGRPDGPPP